MPTLSSGDTLSLANLRDSSAGTAASISSVWGSTPSAGSNISFSSFAIDSVGSLSGFTYGVEGTNENYTLSFGGAGSNHDSKLAQYASNFTWTRAAGSTITIGGSQHKTATVTFSAIGTSTSLSSVQSNTLRVVYDETYNGHIGGGNGMGANKDKTIYSVDSYDGNSAALCLTADSPILLADGTIIEAGDLEEGDVLKGYSLSGLGDDSDGTFLEWSTSELGEVARDVTITNLTYSFASRYYDVNNGEITGTADHPMLVKDSTDGLFRFKELHNLVNGDKLIKQNGNTLDEIEVTSVTTTDSTVEIVSIDVEEQDTYLVNGYVTHNKGGNSFTDFAGPGAPGRSYSTGPATISWTAPTATLGGTTAYDWQMATDSGFGSIHASGTEWNSTSHNVSGFPTDTYYLRVRAREAGIAGTWSSTLTISHTFDT